MDNMLKLYLINAGAQLSDWATTYTVFKLDNKQGNANEANPFMRYFVKKDRWKTLFLFKCAIVFMPAFIHRNLKDKDPVAYKAEVKRSLKFSTILTGLVALNNAKISLRIFLQNKLESR